MRCDCSTAYMHQAPPRRLHPSPPHPEPPNPTHTAAIALIGLALLLEAAQAFVPVSPLNNIHARSSRPSSGSRRGASALVMKAGRVRFDLEIDRVVDGLGRIESITSVRPTDGSISRIQSRPIIDSPNPPPPPRIPHTRQMAIKPGSMVALVTPMKPDGAIDEQQLRDLLRWHVACETDGVVVLGTTGEVSGWVLVVCVVWGGLSTESSVLFYLSSFSVLILITLTHHNVTGLDALLRGARARAGHHRGGGERRF